MKRASTIVLLAFTLIFSSAALAQPGAPSPASPANGAVKVAMDENLIWNNTFTVDSFRLQIATDTSFTSLVLDTTQGASILYKLRQGLVAHYVTYYWRVQGIDMNGAGPWSNFYSFRTIDALPLPPTLLKPTNNFKNTPTFPDFFWSQVARATQYQLQVATSSGFGATSLKLDSTINSSKHVIEYLKDTLTIGGTYYWRMRAENEAGWGNWSNEFSFEVAFLPPNKPVLMSPADNAVDQFLTPTFYWSASNQTTRYRFYLATNREMTNVVYKDSTNKQNHFWFHGDVLKLNPNTTYYWTVAAGNDDDFYSRNSDTFTFTTINATLPSRPVNLTPKTASVQHSRTPAFTWADTSTSPADSFYLHISTFNLFTDTALLAKSTVPNYTVSASAPLGFDEVFYWRVIGKNDAGFSPWSFFWNLTTGINNPVKDAFKASLYPNPATVNTTFEFELKETGDIRIALTDISGREVLEVYSGILSADKYNFDINLAALPAGTYYTVITNNAAMQAVPFVKQ